MRKFSDRHIGISEVDEKSMKDFLGVESLEQLIQETIPDEIRTKEELKLDNAKVGAQGSFIRRKIIPQVISFNNLTIMAHLL